MLKFSGYSRLIRGRIVNGRGAVSVCSVQVQAGAHECSSTDLPRLPDGLLPSTRHSPTCSHICGYYLLVRGPMLPAVKVVQNRFPSALAARARRRAYLRSNVCARQEARSSPVPAPLQQRLARRGWSLQRTGGTKPARRANALFCNAQPVFLLCSETENRERPAGASCLACLRLCVRRPSDRRGSGSEPEPQCAFKVSMFSVSCNSH